MVGMCLERMSVMGEESRSEENARDVFGNEFLGEGGRMRMGGRGLEKMSDGKAGRGSGDSGWEVFGEDGSDERRGRRWR